MWTKEELAAFGLLQICTWVWKTAVFLLPLVSVAVFIHAWRVQRGGRQVGWHSRILMLGALVIFAVTLIRTSLSIQFTCIYANTEPYGSTTLPLAMANVGHATKFVSIGIVAAAFCLALALLLPIGNKRNEPPTTR